MKRFPGLGFFACSGVLLLWACTSVPILPQEKVAQIEVDSTPTMDVRGLYFNSRDIGSKSPMGAVVPGVPVRYSLTAREGDLDGVNLVIRMRIEEGNHSSLDYVDVQSLAMEKSSGTEHTDKWTGEFTYEIPGIYAYHFELIKGNETLAYGNNRNLINIGHESAQGTGGLGRVSETPDVEPYRQTVYFPQAEMKSDPQRRRDIIYYIFPERFKNGNKANDPIPGKTWFYGGGTAEFHQNWSDPKPWIPGTTKDGHSGDDGEYNNDFYGGDLEGLTQKLDYLKSLGVTMIYSTPINPSPSNHKYDAVDYKDIDPAFGGMKAFETFIAEAKKRGIGFIMDASLNHASSASRYFDRYSIHPELGAFEGEQIRKDSPYYDWFEFNPRGKKPSEMYNFWAVDTLANLQESASWKDFAFGAPDSITRFWLKKGIAGWRMDVAPWVSHEFWKEWYKAVKETNPDAYTVAEVWFDSSHFLYGDEFDAGMNYIFRSSALALAKGEDTKNLAEAMEMLKENYPKPVFYRMMNLTSTHDVPRTLWELGYKEYGDANYPQTRARLLLSAAFQFTMPGIPTVYYGDEVGMTGGPDPMNRGPFPWKEDGADYGDTTLTDVYRSLAQIRKEHAAILADGELEFQTKGGNLLSYVRTGTDGKRITVLFNNGSSAVVLPLAGSWKDLTSGAEFTGGVSLEPVSFRILLSQ